MRSSERSFINIRRTSSDFDDMALRSSSYSSTGVSPSTSPSGSNYTQFARLLSLQLQRQVLLEQQSRSNSALLQHRRTIAVNDVTEALDSAASCPEDMFRRHSSCCMVSSPSIGPTTAPTPPRRLTRTSSLKVVANATLPEERLEILDRKIAAQRQMREATFLMQTN